MIQERGIPFTRPSSIYNRMTEGFSTMLKCAYDISKFWVCELFLVQPDGLHRCLKYSHWLMNRGCPPMDTPKWPLYLSEKKNIDRLTIKNGDIRIIDKQGKLGVL